MEDHQSKVLTLIICTYNRNDIIRLCLDSIQKQTTDSSLFDVLIVDNYDNVANHAELESLANNLDSTQIVQEPRSGLSIARNTGCRYAKTPWVGYVDDDCILPPSFIKRALYIIDNHSFDCFGGHICSWWHYARPKWLSPDFGSKPKLSVDISIINENYNWGGNIFFRKDTLSSVGGFEEGIGMTSDKIGYSAENRVQIKLRKKGFKIGYDPNLTLHHLVGKHKLNILWHLKASYAEGRDAREVFKDQYTSKTILKDTLRIPIIFINGTLKLIRESQFYWQNWLLFFLKPLFNLAGKLRSCLG